MLGLMRLGGEGEGEHVRSTISTPFSSLMETLAAGEGDSVKSRISTLPLSRLIGVNTEVGEGECVQSSIMTSSFSGFVAILVETDALLAPSFLLDDDE